MTTKASEQQDERQQLYKRLSNADLREELEKLRRYRQSLIAEDGRSAYEYRVTGLTNAMFLRGMLSRDELAVELKALTPPRCTLKPLADNVVVLPDKGADTTQGGLVIPDSAKAVPSQGEVLAVGPGIDGQERLIDGYVRPLSVMVGDRVLFGRYSGLEFVLDGETVLIMPERDILGVLG